MANNFTKIEIQKISNCSPFTKFNNLRHYHSNNASIKLGNRNYKVHLIRNTNCRFYSQISIENFTFGELLSKNKNIDSFVNDCPLGKHIPSYMLENFKYPSLAICTEGSKQEIAHSQNNGVNYYSFDLKDNSPVALTKVKEIDLTLLQKSGTQISSNNVAKHCDLSAFYEHYFSSSKVYFVKCNSIEGENDVKVKTITRHLYPLNRTPIMLVPDPVLKYLNLFRTKQEAKYTDNKLCLKSAENRDPSNPKSRIREKPVPRAQLPLDINPNTHSIGNIINSIDRSEAIIHKDLYITNRVVDLLKKEDKKKEEKNPVQAKNRELLSTNSRLDTTKVDQILATANVFSYIETDKTPSKSYGNNPQSHESAEITEKMPACSTSQDMPKRNELFFVTETEKKIDNTNTADKLSSYDEAENNLMAEYSNDGYKLFISETKKEVDKIPFSKYSNSNGRDPAENCMSQVIAIKSLSHVNEDSLYTNKHLANDYSRKPSKVILSEHGASGMVSVEKLSSQNNLVKSVIVSGPEEKVSEQADVSRKENNLVVIHPKVEEINNHSDSRSITNKPNLTYPPTFVDNIVSNLRNPTPKKPPQTTTSQCRGSHSNSSHESDGTVDVLTKTSITSMKFGKKAKIQIHEVQTYKDRRLPIKFTTDTLMEMQGSNEKLKAATEVVEVAKAKLVLSRSNADADVKSGVESAIKLADLISFLKHKVMVGYGSESSKIPIQIDPQLKEIKSLTRQYAPKSVKTPDKKPTNLPNLSGKPKQGTEIQKTKTSFPEEPKKRTNEKVSATKTVNLQDGKTKTDEVNKVADTQPTNKVLDKNKKPEDEVKVIKVKSHDLKKILNRSDNTEHSIRLIDKIEKKDIPQKSLRKSIKHYAEKKKKKFHSTKKMETPQEMRKKIMEIKPVVEDALKKGPVERKTTKPLQNITESGKKEVDLTDRDLKILENIKKGSGGTPSIDTATVPSKETSKKLKNEEGENKDLLKDMISTNKANIKRDPVTYDVIKIPGDEEVKAKLQKLQKKKNIVLITGEKEGNQDKRASSVKEGEFKESKLQSEDNKKVEMVAVKVQIRNKYDVLESYKNVFIKKTIRNPLVIRKGIPKLTDPNKIVAGTKKRVSEFLAKERDKLRVKKSDKLDSKTISDVKQHSKEIRKEDKKYLPKEKLSDKKIVSQNIKDGIVEKYNQKDPVSEKKATKSSQIITPTPKKTDVSAKDTKNVSSKKMASQLEKKDIEEVASKKPATKASEPSEIIPPISKKPVSVKEGKSIPSIRKGAQEIKKELDINKVVDKKPATKISEPSEIIPPLSKKPVSVKEGKSIPSIRKGAQEVKKDLDINKVVDKKPATKISEPSEIIPPISKKPVSVEEGKSIPNIRKEALEIKKELDINKVVDKKPATKISEPSEIIPPISKKSVSVEEGKSIPNIRKGAQEIKKDLDINKVVDKKPATKISEPSEIIPPISKKSVSVKEGKSIPSIRKGAQEIKKDLDINKVVDKKTASKISKPSKIIPPVSKKPVSVKEGKSIPSIRKGAQEVKKDLDINKVVDKKTASKVSKPSKIIPPVSKKPVSVKEGKSIPSIKRGAQEIKKEVSSPVVKKSKISPKDNKIIGKASLQEKKKIIKQDLVSGKPSPATKKPDISKSLKGKTSKESKLNEQSQKTDPSGVSTEFTSRRSSEKAAGSSKSEIKEQKPESLKRKTTDPSTSPVHPTSNFPVSFAKSKSVAMSGDLFIDLDKLSKETKPAIDARSAMRLHVPLDKLMEFPLMNAQKALRYGRPNEGITCVDCKKDPVLRQKLKTIPSVTRVLNATMSDSSRIALAKWRSKMVADLGEAGFQEFYKGQIESGSEFHEKIQKHFSGFSQDLVNSPNPALRSVSTVSKHISEVSVVESHVIHNKLAYRGIIDCVAKYDNKPVLIEWKRSDKKKKLIQSTFDAPLQLCAYIGALNYDTNYKMQARMKKVQPITLANFFKFHKFLRNPPIPHVQDTSSLLFLNMKIDAMAKLQVQGGVVVVAYSDGSPADVFTIPLEECQKYWKQWLSRLKMYLLDDYGK
uniref:Mitochondrial genome maintenance exonuclease 1 n=1 Tax=Rhodnius prolixus TaxID=13249 RepID=T1HRR1_RHOPR